MPGTPAPYGPPAGAVPGNATASLVLGLVGIFLCPLVCSIAAIGLGVSARKEIDANPHLGGRSTAGWGIGLGIAGIAFWLIGLAIIAGGASLGGLTR